MLNNTTNTDLNSLVVVNPAPDASAPACTPGTIMQTTFSGVAEPKFYPRLKTNNVGDDEEFAKRITELLKYHNDTLSSIKAERDLYKRLYEEAKAKLNTIKASI